MDSLATPFTAPDSAQPTIAKSDRRHGARNFGDESIATVLSIGDFSYVTCKTGVNYSPPTGIFPCPSLRVLCWSTRPFLCFVHPIANPPCEFAVVALGVVVVKSATLVNTSPSLALASRWLLVRFSPNSSAANCLEITHVVWVLVSASTWALDFVLLCMGMRR